MIDVGRLNGEDVQDGVLIGPKFGISWLPLVCVDISF